MLNSHVIAVLLAVGATVLGIINGQAISLKDLSRCRQSCYLRFVQDWHNCMQFEDCKNMCITPPNINNYIPEAFSFLCWDNCDEQLGPFPLNVNSAVRQGSLVLTDIAWDQAVTNASKQCLVTWEVSGGGLMGNLLTDSSTVELSLWPDTVYHVQVTCKHKETGGMRRSFKLIVDTHKLSNEPGSRLHAISMENVGVKSLPNVFSQDTSSGETDSRMRILKDSSKDFISTYNPSFSTVERTSSSNQKASNSDSSSSTPVQVSSVVRTKLTSSTVSSVFSTDSWPQSIVFAAVGAVLLVAGMFLLYILTRPTRKHLPIDKESLINHEITPEQVSKSISSSANRTLHV